MTPCHRDVDLKNNSRQKGERDTPAKQHQTKAWATKTHQDLPVNMVINNRLLACNVEIGYALNYAKAVLRVSPYFQVLALLKLFHYLLSLTRYIQIIITNSCHLY
jgi:hypothetical protein